MKMPVVFVSHGAPDIALSTNATTQCWQALGKQLPTPKAILVLSAHWTTQQPIISNASQPETIYDFGGFPNALYQLTYPAQGAPELAQDIQALLQTQGINAQLEARGLDHGAWIPLLAMYPDATIPVLQLSIQPHLEVAWHIKLGQSLSYLREQGVLILGSGAVTHNFAWLKPHSSQAFTPAQQFADWLGHTLVQRDTQSLYEYRNLAPYGQAAHPTDEHLLPLMAIYGASQADDQLTRYTPEYTYAALAMDAYLWA